ncbi:MAG: SpoIIE family protein phosphatase [Marinagarivorans sp.]|nr:SpoIIE family protein phosphatase [Marinagarivorans sp.]
MNLFKNTMFELAPNISRILVVDDDEILNYLFCSFLSSRGFETLPAHGIGDAKAMLQSDNAIDLIILDYQLGDGVGMDLLESMSLANYINFPPVIMISANEEPEFLEKCFSGGVNDYIIKPVNLSLLALKVESLIKSVSMQRLITKQNQELENFKREAEREEQVAKFTYEYLLRQNSNAYDGVEVWLKSFAAFSGDMALVKKSPSGNLYFILADATGHGLSAAITIMPLVTIFNSMVSKGFHIQKIVTEINRKMVSDTPADRFVAATVIEVDPFRREFSVWSGGMPPVLWVDAGQITHQVNAQHMALGIMDDDMFDASVTTISFPKSGFIFTYTDGLTEQENVSGEPFSVARVRNIIAQQPHNLLQELSSNLLQFAQTENYSDDVSICMIQPNLVFSNMAEIAIVEKLPSSTCYLSNYFNWSLTLSGNQLENCEIPPLCNHFLHQVGAGQELCQKIFAVLSEMVSNALDHGVLGLSSSIKESPDGFMRYFSEREQRLKILTDKDFVKLSMQWFPNNGDGYLLVEVEDSGAGYIPKNETSGVNTQCSGRGSGLIQKLSASVEIISPGNKIRATIK